MTDICYLCGNPIYDNEVDATYFEQKVHLECVHDIMHPEEENERL